jgi:hypothetical protein
VRSLPRMLKVISPPLAVLVPRRSLQFAGFLTSTATQGGGQEITIQNSLSNIVHHGVSTMWASLVLPPVERWLLLDGSLRRPPPCH